MDENDLAASLLGNFDTYAHSIAIRQKTIADNLHQLIELMKTNRFHHIAIICSDYKRSKQFYVDILGFSIIKETLRGERNSYKLDLRVGDQDRIELFSFLDPPPRPTKPEACGLRHLAFEVDDIDESVSYLNSKGLEVEPIRLDEITGKRYTFFKDPDGLPLEIYEH